MTPHGGATWIDTTGDDPYAVLEREPDEPGPVGEIDLGGVPTGAVRLGAEVVRERLREDERIVRHDAQRRQRARNWSSSPIHSQGRCTDRPPRPHLSAPGRRTSPSARAGVNRHVSHTASRRTVTPGHSPEIDCLTAARLGIETVWAVSSIEDFESLLSADPRESADARAVSPLARLTRRAGECRSTPVKNTAPPGPRHKHSRVAARPIRALRGRPRREVRRQPAVPQAGRHSTLGSQLIRPILLSVPATATAEEQSGSRNALVIARWTIESSCRCKSRSAARSHERQHDNHSGVAAEDRPRRSPDTDRSSRPRRSVWGSARLERIGLALRACPVTSRALRATPSRLPTAHQQHSQTCKLAETRSRSKLNVLEGPGAPVRQSILDRTVSGSRSVLAETCRIGRYRPALR